MRAANVAFVGALVHRFPVLMPLLQEHLDFNEELLAHVLMGDVTRWVVSEHEADSGSSTVGDVLDFIEESFSHAGEHEQELIIASFLENLPRPPEAGADIRERVGPELREVLEEIG